MDRQPQITDLIPRSPVTYVLLFLGGLAVVVGLEALYAWMPDLSSMTTDGQVASFDLDGEGSLAVWFSSAVLALASMTALIVYSVRRHKADDYHGRYRIWIWAALCWMMMSIDECASLHEGFKELMVRLSGHRVFGDGSVWWVAAYGLVLFTVGIRLLLEMRVCKSSTVALGATAICFGVAVATQVGVILPEGNSQDVMVEEGCEMVGDLFLLMAMALHARFVILQAEGKLGEAKPRPRRAAKVKEAAAPAVAAASAEPPKKRSWFGRGQVDPAHAAPPTPAKRSDLAPTRSTTSSTTSNTAAARPQAPSTAPLARKVREVQADSDAGGETSDGTRRMSKAERKALRRQQERERQDY